MSDLSQGPGWWLASDGKWYAPELHPRYRPPSVPGWWQASDGRWYPPEQHPDPALSSGDTPASVDTVAVVEPGDSPNAQWRADPFGRFESRHFFLGRPTSLVKNGDVVGYDDIDELAPASKEPAAAAGAAATGAAGAALSTPASTVGGDSPTTPTGGVRSLFHGRGPVYLVGAAVLILIGGILALIFGLSSPSQPVAGHKQTVTTPNPAVHLPSGQGAGTVPSTSASVPTGESALSRLRALVLQAQGGQPHSSTSTTSQATKTSSTSKKSTSASKKSTAAKGSKPTTKPTAGGGVPVLPTSTTTETTSPPTTTTTPPTSTTTTTSPTTTTTEPTTTTTTSPTTTTTEPPTTTTTVDTTTTTAGP